MLAGVVRVRERIEAKDTNYMPLFRLNVSISAVVHVMHVFDHLIIWTWAKFVV